MTASEAGATVRVERVDETVGRVVMDRPETHNAMDESMAAALRDAVLDLVEDDAVRCVVLTGAGPAFNTGADLAALDGTAADGRRLRAVATRLHTAVAALASAPKPVVTAVNGVAAGGGFGLALAGDLVLVSETARLEYAYTRLGVSGDGGSTYFLPRLVGSRRAREIALLDEPITPETAVADGLATEVVPADDLTERTAELAARLAEGPTQAHGATKRLLTRSFSRDLRTQLAAETDSISRLTATEDYAAGHAAFGEEESPEFEGQ
jgi:2-(1,2-epoxy-1,2-dihydrophenyl)acetyl-CoA isomerase